MAIFGRFLQEGLTGSACGACALYPASPRRAFDNELAVIGMVLQDGLTGSACGARALFTTSPPRAFDNELGGQAPGGFGDPAGFTAEGIYENFASCCQAERTSWQSSASPSRRASLALPAELGPCTRHLRCARSTTSLEFRRQLVSVILLASRLMETTRISPAATRRSGKHGHVSMLGTMGYINPDITRKLLGFLSPSAGLKFGDIPNGLAAISKVPAGGGGQILAYGGFCELSQDQSAGNKAAADDFGFNVLASSDPSVKTKN